MTAAIRLDRDRLGKLLGMLGSAHDGEVAAAGRMADALVRSAGLTWHQVVEESAWSAVTWRKPATLDEAIELCFRWPELLTEWELSFCSSLRRQRRSVSAKQEQVLLEIVARVERHVRAAGRQR